MQAQREGQTWLLYKPIKAGELQPIQSEEVLSHVVSKPKAFRPVSFQTWSSVAFDLAFIFPSLDKSWEIV